MTLDFRSTVVFVSVFVTTTVALAIRPPMESFTVPWIVARDSWAPAIPASVMIAATRHAIRFMSLFLFSTTFFFLVFLGGGPVFSGPPPPRGGFFFFEKREPIFFVAFLLFTPKKPE